MRTPVLSVIVPVYNAKDTIERCLKSILNQTLKELEIIVTDDCSEDNSVEIIKKIRDERIILIENEKNLGCGSSRNIGVERARGEFIGFVDNDDFVDNDYFEKMINALISSEAEVCVALKIINHTKGKIKKHCLKARGQRHLKEIVFVDRTAPWAKVCRKNFFTSNGVKFDAGRGEDIFPAFLESFHAKKIACISNSGYHCTIRKGSISHKMITRKDLGEIKVYKKIIKYLDGACKNESEKKFWMSLIRRRAMISVDFLYRFANNELKKAVLSAFSEVFSIKEECTKIEYKIFKFQNFIQNLESYIFGLF